MSLITFSQIKSRIRPKLIALLRRFKLLPLAKRIYIPLRRLFPVAPPAPRAMPASFALMAEVRQELDKNYQPRSIIFLPKP